MPLRLARPSCLRAIALVLCASSALAGDRPRTAEWYSRPYRTVDGLPSSIINAIVQDQSGYLWLGTTLGLVRFDGLEFAHWKTVGGTRLPVNDVMALMT